MVRRSERLVGIALGFALLAVPLFAPASSAQTAVVVTLCDQDDQAGAGVNLVNALATATNISFDCPAGSRLLWTATRQLGSGAATHVKIDGSNQGRPLALVYGIPNALPALVSMISLFPGSRLDLVDVTMDSGPDVDFISMGVSSQGVLRIIGGRFTGFRSAVQATRGELRVAGARFERNHTAVGMMVHASLGLVTGSRFVDNRFGVSVSPGIPGLDHPQAPVYTVEGSLFERNEIAVTHCFEAECPQAARLTVANSVVSHSKGADVAVRGRSILLVNDTLIDNEGDGLRVIGAGSILLLNTILTGPDGVACSVNIVDLGHNIQSPGSSCGGTILVADPALSPLLEPTAESPALGEGDADACDGYPVSGRDFYRKPRLVNETCSIGAVEGPIQTPVVPPPTQEG